ncbi:MAG: excinuclease ABC subunit UvrC [Oscillospiraceae bacterium]
MNDRLDYLKSKTKKLPLLPGVYIMKNKSGDIIYIGKAKALKNRVTSYFTSIDKHTPKVYKMVSHVYDFDYIVTTTEFEALVLECSLIKEHEPKYNILLKDSKGYHYIKITNEPFGRITAVKQRLEDNAEYIGPYISSFAVKQAVEEANKAFLLPTCRRKFPQDIGKERPCLNYHIKTCMAPCLGKISADEYSKTLEDAVKYIKYGEERSIKALTEQMHLASENLEFEKAARLRDKIIAINKISDKQRVSLDNEPFIDVIAFAKSKEMCCAVVLKYRNSKLSDKLDYTFPFTEDLNELREEFLVRFYTDNNDIPKNILIDEELSDAALYEEYISSLSKGSVSIKSPQKGEKLRLIEMAHTNCGQILAEKVGGRTAKELSSVDRLGQILGLKKPPQYIEAYDISNIGAQTIVAGMVVFENGRPFKEAYRKFAITSVVGNPDDYTSMKEVITRRLNRYEQEKDTGVGFGRLPDLILLDGGKGHLSVVLPIIKSFGLNISVFGMVKDSKHRTRAIAAEAGEISISKDRAAFALVTQIQDEVHRFSIDYSRKKHQKELTTLVLENVAGVGQKRLKELYKKFGSVSQMENATVEELASTESMNLKTAQAVYEFLHNENDQ